MQYDLFTQHKYKFFCLGSGSSGNCYYLGTRDYGILIDAGIGVRTVKKTLKDYGVSMEKIIAVLITHDHADHTKSLRAFGDKLNIPIYTTETIHTALKNNRYLDLSLITSRRIIEKEVPFAIKDFQITAFQVPHDSAENVGYHIICDNEVFVLATDIGCITPTLEKYAKEATQLVVETNYDEEMLWGGRYPAHLKQRICNGTGHISNKEMAEFLSNIYSNKLKNIWLCHLSQDNNHPDLAFKTIETAIASKGAKVNENIRLDVLSRYKASGLREF